MRRSKTFGVLFLTATLFLGACGSKEDTTAQTGAADISGETGTEDIQNPEEELKSQMGFYVDGTTLYDANGNPFVMRGVNHAHTWFSDKMFLALDALEETGSNCVRIVLSNGEQWNKTEAKTLEGIINLCKEHKLIAVLEVHDPTGNSDEDSLLAAAQYFVDVKDALIGQEEYVIINIANEWPANSDSKAWKNAYLEAIPMLREAGLAHTIMVDSAGWGQYAKCIDDAGAEVFAADPLGNVMFSVHMYGTAGGTAEKIEQNLRYATEQNLCVCVGEFGFDHSDGDVDEAFLMQYCEENAIGYLAWSWKGNGGDVAYLDMAEQWDGGLTEEWGEVVVNGPNGIRETSKLCTVFTEEEKTADDPFAQCTYIDKEMYERATAYPQGNLSRIAAALRKAEAGEKVTIGVIGGSITQGSAAGSYDSCYASLFKKWWEDTFPNAEIEFINAGVGSTTSYLGVHRVEEELLSYEPDFVIVEFAVNDSNTNFFKKSYDNLIRRIMTEDYNPAVLLLFMTMEDGTSAQGNQSLIGFQYEIPMISYGNIVLDEIKEGSFTWDDISPDNIHPNDRGHAIVAEILDVYLTDIYTRLDEIETEVTPFDKDVITKEVYMDATILCADDIKPIQWGSFEVADINDRFPGNWYTESGGESIIFEVEAANIGIMYQEMVNKDGGKYEVYVDGEHVTTLNADFANGWGDYSEACEVYVSDEKAVHTVEIKKAEDSEGSVFALLGLLIS